MTKPEKAELIQYRDNRLQCTKCTVKLTILDDESYSICCLAESSWRFWYAGKNVHFLPILSVEISFAQFAITTCEKEMKCIKK